MEGVSQKYYTLYEESHSERGLILHCLYVKESHSAQSQFMWAPLRTVSVCALHAQYANGECLKLKKNTASKEIAHFQLLTQKNAEAKVALAHLFGQKKKICCLWNQAETYS